MTLSFKPGVQLAGIQPQTSAGMTVAWSTFLFHGLPLVITSVCDVAPGRVHNSKHASGLAFDCRLPSRWGAPTSTDDTIRTELAASLGSEWFVLLHGAGLDRHIHIQFNGSTP